MLDFIERHKEGILGTIVIHLVLVTVVLIMKISSIQNKELSMQVNLLSEQEVQELLDPEAKKEEVVQNKEVFTPSERAYLGARNMATNEAEQNAADRINQMVNEIKGELNIKDPSPAEKTTDQPPSENALPDKTGQETKTNISRSTTGVHTFYKGPTTVSYYLEGRYDISLPIPVYKCQGNGKVVMSIEVNQQGYIVKTEVDRAKSNISEDCILETAQKAARSTRFNPLASGSATQKGILTYIFIGQ